jgi:hypothetical protein
MHVPVGTKVTIVKYDPEFNGQSGTILDRDGEYYTVDLTHHVIYGIYLCEMEIHLD